MCLYLAANVRVMKLIDEKPAGKKAKWKIDVFALAIRKCETVLLLSSLCHV